MSCLPSVSCLFVFFACCLSAIHAQENQLEKARARIGDLRFEAYATSSQVAQLATDEAVRARGWEVIQRMGITKVFVEVYRGGHVVPVSQLEFVRDWLQEKGIDVVGGIATVPGGDFGLRQEGPLGWFNWQNPKTRRDVEKVIRTTAGIFDTFVVDDFLCTGDVSEESRVAKGDRSWGTYRRSLITDVAQHVFVEPAKEVNPSITMIVKYPQWYDRFHLFGYDTVTLPQIFDQVWVGTESRGRMTQRFGFVQPYEGFVNYRWLADVAPRKIRGAWFDHGDCAEHDFLDQAYMSVLAGARELVFFNFGDVMAGHPDHDKVVAQFDRLADLAASVREHPANGISAYKPPNSDPAGDMFLFDFLGMLGIPIVPVHEFPTQASVILLPAQAAADPLLLEQVRKARERGARLIMTTSLLNVSPQSRQLATMAGLAQVVKSQPFEARLTVLSPESERREVTDVTVQLEGPLEIDAGLDDVMCTDGTHLHAMLVRSLANGVAVLNTHTFSQADFDAVGEVLLAPRLLGILAMEGQSLRAFRAAFRGPNDPIVEGPNGVTLHRLRCGDEEAFVVQNFNDHPVHVALTAYLASGKSVRYKDVLADRDIGVRVSSSGSNATLDVDIPARGRVWIQPNDQP